MSNLVQIQSSDELRRQIVGTLPNALTKSASNFREDVIEPAMEASDGLLRGKFTNPAGVKEAKRIIQRFGVTVKREFCKSYRYPDPAGRDQWVALCASGENSKFLAQPSQCLNCVLFCTDNIPAPYQVPVEVMFGKETLNEAR